MFRVDCFIQKFGWRHHKFVSATVTIWYSFCLGKKKKKKKKQQPKHTHMKKREEKTEAEKKREIKTTVMCGGCFSQERMGKINKCKH